MIESAYAFVQRATRRARRTIHGLTRVDADAYPPVAVREAIANAVVHRDLAITGAVIRVFVFDRHIEINSPGGLLPGLTVENMARSTLLRNRHLADLLYHVGYIERQGTGIRRMQHAMRAGRACRSRDFGPIFARVAAGRLLQVRPRGRPARRPRGPASATAWRPPPARTRRARRPSRPEYPPAPAAHPAARPRRDHPRRVRELLPRRHAHRQARPQGLLDARLIAHRGSSTASYYVLARSTPSSAAAF